MISRHAWLSLLTLAALLFGPFAVAPQVARAATFTFQVDRLDDVASPGTCNDLTDNDCSLRAAINLANTTGTNDDTKIISFEKIIAEEAGPRTEAWGWVINLVNQLPKITADRVEIDAETFFGIPQIAINGNGRAVGFELEGDRGLIRGLSLYGFSNSGIEPYFGSAIYITGAENSVEISFIGIRPNFTIPDENNFSGIRIDGVAATDNIIGGTGGSAVANFISGNDQNGVIIRNASGNFVQNNFVGLGRSGTTLTPLPNGQYGIQITSLNGTSANNVIGGNSSSLANVVGSNTQSGIYLRGSGTVSNTIQSNYIGIDKNSDTTFPNGDGGVVIENGASNNTLIGFSAGPLVVSGNNNYGIRIRSNEGDSVLPSDNRITGFVYIGTNRGGNASRGNNGGGVLIENAVDTVINGNTNIRVGGNNGPGITVRGDKADNTQLSGARIGIASSSGSTVQISNSGGGVLIDQARNTMLSGNWVSGNTFANTYGIRLSEAVSTTLQSNFIGLNVNLDGTVGNAGAGIDVQNSVNTSIGGASGDELNVISGNAGPGIRISGSDTVSTTVDGNYIGVSLASGQYTADAGNSGPGVLLENGPRQTTIGGFGNRIAANTGPGVQISATLPNTVTLTTLLANTIGFAPNGNQAPFELPNSEGVVIAGDGVSSVDVLSNTIRFNANDGIAVTAATTVTLRYNAAISDNDGRGVYVAEGAERVQIRDNTIESNGAAAILLEDAATERVTMIDNQIARNVEPVTLLGTTAYNGTPPDTATPGPNHDIDPPFGIRVDRNGLISGFVYTGTFELNNDDPVFTPASACVEGPNGPCRIAVYQSDPELSSPDEQPWTRLGFQGGDDLIPASDGLFSGELSSPVPINGQLLFAATDGFGNTSAFAAFTVTPGLALTPLDPADAALESAPSQTVTYTLRLSNTGTLDLPNVALFTGGTLAGWDATVTPNQVAIAAGGERVLTVTLDLPVGTDLNAAAGIIDTTVVTANVTGLVTATQELQTTVLEQAVLRVQPVRGEGSGRPGTRVAYAHRLSNDGNITVTVDLDYFTQDPANSPLWNDNTTISTDTVTIAPGDFRDIGVNVTVPETGQVGTQATTYISATVASYPDQTRYFSDTTTVALEVEAEMFPDETQPGEAGGEVIFYHTVRNLSNGPATYRLNTQANYDSTVTFESDTPGVTINPASNTFTLDNVFAPPLRTNTMRLKVTVRLDPLLLPGDQEVLNIFLTDAATNSSIGGAAVVDRVNITRGQIQPRLWFPMLFN